MGKRTWRAVELTPALDVFAGWAFQSVFRKLLGVTPVGWPVNACFPVEASLIADSQLMKGGRQGMGNGNTMWSISFLIMLCYNIANQFRNSFGPLGRPVGNGKKARYGESAADISDKHALIPFMLKKTINRCSHVLYRCEAMGSEEWRRDLIWGNKP